MAHVPKEYSHTDSIRSFHVAGAGGSGISKGLINAVLASLSHDFKFLGSLSSGARYTLIRNDIIDYAAYVELPALFRVQGGREPVFHIENKHLFYQTLYNLPPLDAFLGQQSRSRSRSTESDQVTGASVSNALGKRSCDTRAAPLGDITNTVPKARKVGKPDNHIVAAMHTMAMNQMSQQTSKDSSLHNNSNST